MMRTLQRILLAALVAASAAYASAQTYPSKAIRLVVPFPPGGTTDILAREVGQRLTEVFGQPVVIDNRPGAAGNIGSDIVAKSAPDGYTLLLCTVSSHAINPGLYSKLPYDHIKDFAPVILVARVPNVLEVNPGVPVYTVADLVKLAKEKPGQINFASSGSGTSIHLWASCSDDGGGMLHALEAGCRPLIGGQVQVMWDNSFVLQLDQSKPPERRGATSAPAWRPRSKTCRRSRRAAFRARWRRGSGVLCATACPLRPHHTVTPGDCGAGRFRGIGFCCEGARPRR